MLQIGSVLGEKNIQYDNIHYAWDGQHTLGVNLLQSLKITEFIQTSGAEVWRSHKPDYGQQTLEIIRALTNNR